MKLKLTIIALLLMLGLPLSAQTADDHVAAGRAFLSATNLAAANNSFSNAVALSPSHQVGNVFYAATRLLILPTQPAGSNFLNRIGMPVAGRDIYNWTAELPADTNGVVLAPAGVNANETSAMLRTNILPALLAAGANLAKVTDTNFTFLLTSDETRSSSVTIDFGDLLLLRAGLKFLEYTSYTFNSWNLDAPLAAIRQLFTDGATTTEGFLAQYPSLLTYATTNDLASARQSFSDAVALYQSASDFMRRRPTNETRLFNYDVAMTNSEAEFRTTLGQLNESLNGPVVVTANTNYTVQFGRHFDGLKSPRHFLPQFSRDAIIAGTFPDATFGGIITHGLAAYQIENFLSLDKFWGNYPHIYHIPAIPFVSRFITPQQLPDGRFQINFDQLAGTAFLIQYSTNLQTWTDLTIATTTDGSFSFVDGNSSRRFYRAVDVTYFFTVNGNVTDVATGNSVPNATVSVSFPYSSGYPPVGTYSDNSGNYLLMPNGPFYDTFLVNIAAAGYSSSQYYGNQQHVTMPVYLAPIGYHPPNDNFTQRLPLAGTNITTSGNNISATLEAGEPPLDAGGASVWWTWTAPADGSVIVDTQGSSIDTVLAVYTGNSISNLELVTLGYSSDINNNSRVNFFVTAGVTYQICVDIYTASAGGRVVLHLHSTLPMAPTILAQDSGYAFFSIGSYSYFSVNATGTAPLTFQWRKDGTNLPSATDSSYPLNILQTNQTGVYSVVVSNAAGSITSAPVSLFVIPNGPPANDGFANRVAIPGSTNLMLGSNVSATKEGGEPNHAGNTGGKSVWWTWTAPASRTVTLDTFGSSFDTVLAVYTGGSVSGLASIASNDDSGGLQSKLTFSAIASTTYQIAVDGYGGNSGGIVLNLH